MNIDKKLLDEYIENFYGYGNHSAKFWFIGMEEGGGNNIEELYNRLFAWNARGCKELEDIAEYHNAIGMNLFFGDRPNIQKTWGQLIRILLSAKGNGTERECIRLYQRENLGRKFSETCLMELMPLPSRNMNEWIYAEVTRFKTREDYIKNIMPARIKRIQQFIKNNHFKCVIFYGKKYTRRWIEIIGNEPLECDNGFMWSIKDNSLYLIINHPCRVSNNYCECVGDFIREKTSQSNL